MDTPHPHVPPAGHIAGKLKDPKTLAILAVLVIGFSLYIRHRNSSSLAAPSGVGTPVYDPLTDPANIPTTSQGAASDTTGSFGGFDTPPDWYSQPPGWYTDPVTAPDPTGSTDMNVVGVAPGASVYDPHTGKLVTAPGRIVEKPTGGGPPKTSPKAHAKPPAHKPKKASHPVFAKDHPQPRGGLLATTVPTPSATSSSRSVSHPTAAPPPPKTTAKRRRGH